MDLPGKEVLASLRCRIRLTYPEARFSHQLSSRGGADGDGYNYFRPQVEEEPETCNLGPATDTDMPGSAGAVESG
jgi:hypothetical protein